MRTVLVVAIALLPLAGCGSMDFFGDSSAPAVATPPPMAATGEAAPDNTQQAMGSNAVAPTDPAAATTPVMSSSAPSAVQASASSKAHCTALAKQRAMDAAFQGEDSDTQEAVYNRAYSDCIAWDLKHNVY